MNWNNRQEKILSILISSNSPVTLNQLSKQLQVSTKTIQRELIWIKGMIKQFGLQLDSKAGVGITIIGSDESKRQALEVLNIKNTRPLLSSEERMDRLKIMLLTMNEPVKLFALSKELDVSEATTSNDLSKIEDWFEKYGLSLVRKPGLGVHIKGKEKQIRHAILELLYEQLTKEQIISVWQKREKSVLTHADKQLSIWNDLFHFIDQEHVNIIESAVLELKNKYHFHMLDNAYVGMVVHIALALQRLKSGEGIEIDENIVSDLIACEEYEWADYLCNLLSSRLNIQIPESEKLYITMHMLGGNARKMYEDIKSKKSAHYTRDMIYIASDFFQVSLIDDHDLFDCLSQHLDSALFRISMGMKIRNPLLPQVKENYPLVFQAACQVAKYLEKKTGLIIPEEEIGYLAMHFGAAVLRKERDTKPSYRVIIVCASGIGTSRLLAAQIKKELPNLEVVDTVPVTSLNEWLAKADSIDLIISTIGLQEEHLPVVEVSPFLTKEDCLKIETRLSALSHRNHVSEVKIPLHELVLKVNNYGSAVSQVMESFYFEDQISCATKEAVIRFAAERAQLKHKDADVDQIEQDLLYREQMGTWVASGVGLSLIHYRTKGIARLMLAVYRVKSPVSWTLQEKVTTILVLLVPEHAPQEHLEMIGEISAALIDERIVYTFALGTEREIREAIQQILSTAYTEKAKDLIGG